jgi:hypothetical protein
MGSEARMPSLPMAMPSVTAMVLNSTGVHVLREFAQGDVAGRNVGPGMHHADERPRDGLVVQAGRAQHRACGGAGRALLDRVALHCVELSFARAIAFFRTAMCGSEVEPEAGNEKPRTFVRRGVFVSTFGFLLLLTQTRFPHLSGR